MSEQSKHTPLPWRFQGEFLNVVWGQREFKIYTAAGKFGNPATCKAEADAELIVRACNNHDELVNTLERLLTFTTELCADINVSAHYESIENAQMVLVKAKGGQ